MRKLVLVLGLVFSGLYVSNASAQSWKTQSSMKLKRSEAATVEYKGELYVFNGFSKGLFVGNSVEKYNPSTKQWTLLSNTSVANGTAVTHSGVVINGADVWLVGGRIGAHPGKVTKNVWIYNINSKQWRKGPSLPKPMAGGGAAIVNNKLYTFGGVDALAKCDVDYHYVLDLKATSAGWKDLKPSAAMPLARNHFSTIVLNNLIYAIGGQHGHDGCPSKKGGNVAYVHTYNPATNKWNRLANLPSADSHNEPGSFTHNGFIYTVGGTNPGNAVTRYNPQKNQWSRVATLPEKLVAPVARMYNNTLMVAGGGAPITSKSITTVRTLTSNTFNDSVGGVQSKPVVVTPEPEPEPEPVTKPQPEPEPVSQPEPEPITQPDPEPQPIAESKPVSNPEPENVVATQSNAIDGTPIQLAGNRLSWPDDGWYQVLREGDFVEVCAGGLSCEVGPGDYLVINHSKDKRYRNITVGEGNSSASSTTTSSSDNSANSAVEQNPIVVSNNTISWPDNGWYQVQDERQNYKEICGGGRTCQVDNGVYTVINHTLKIRYEGIVVGLNADYVEFENKLSGYEALLRRATDTVLEDINHRYTTGSITPQQSDCIGDLYDGTAAALSLDCSTNAMALPGVQASVWDFTYSGEHCESDLSHGSSDACQLQSAHLYHGGLNTYYQTIDQPESSTRYFVFIDESNTEQTDVVVANGGAKDDYCLMQSHDGHSWRLSAESALALCEAQVGRALEAFSSNQER